MYLGDNFGLFLGAYMVHQENNLLPRPDNIITHRYWPILWSISIFQYFDIHFWCFWKPRLQNFCETDTTYMLILSSSRVDNSANQTQSKSLNLQKTSVAYRNGHHLLHYIRAPHLLTSSRFYKQKLLKCYPVSTVSVYIKSKRKKKHTDHFDYNTLLQSCVLKINAPSQI